MYNFAILENVSTHSRAEAAASHDGERPQNWGCFNTQPRGGGCILKTDLIKHYENVSTHSRAEAAAFVYFLHD